MNAAEERARLALFVIVEATWDDGRLCGDCANCHTWREHHGPGLNEPMGECRILDASGDPRECPGVIASQATAGGM